MSRTAALWAGWDRRAPRSVAGPLGPSRGASRPGMPFLEGTLGPDARIIVEVAWGADLTASSDSWSWIDITTDVFYGGSEGIELFIGAADEASTTQPATCSMRLDNEAGLYSLGTQSPNWPNVRRNTPVRVRVDPGTGAVVVWFGFADGFTPVWGAGGRDARVMLKASGVLRRLSRPKRPVLSSFRRRVQALAGIVAYWPAEDEEKSTSIASGLTGGPALGFYLGPPEFADSTVFDCSTALPRVAGSAWYGPVLPYADTGETQVRALMGFPAGGSPDSTVIFRVHTTGTADLWELRYKALNGGQLAIRAWGAGSVLFETNFNFGIDGQIALVGINLRQNGADAEWGIHALELGASLATEGTGTLVGRMAGIVYKLETNTDDAHQDLILGHITVGSVILPATGETAAALNAHEGEAGPTRIVRLCPENGIGLSLIGNVQQGDNSTRFMGPQTVDSLINLLREAEKVDQGVLHDGLGNGFTYITKRRRENADPFVTIDVAAGELSAQLVPVDDDQRVVNRVTASRRGGSDFTFEDETGPLGTNAIGAYDASETVSNNQDGELAHLASWLVHRGTVEGYRYPRLELDLTHSAALIRAWLTPLIGGRIDVLNIESLLTQHPPGLISLALEGYRHSISQNRWQLSANCSLYEPWRIGVIAAETGDTNPLALRYETDGASLALGVDPGAASLSVNFVGLRFTTLADDFPMQIDLDGLTVTVTTITGTTSPQTFTVDPATVTAPRPAGAPITVITPPPGL